MRDDVPSERDQLVALGDAAIRLLGHSAPELELLEQLADQVRVLAQNTDPYVAAQHLPRLPDLFLIEPVASIAA